VRPLLVEAQSQRSLFAASAPLAWRCSRAPLCAPAAGDWQRHRGAALLPLAALGCHHESTLAAAAASAASAASDVAASVPPLLPPTDVASIAAESNALISSLQYFIEYIHVSQALPWYGAAPPRRLSPSLSMPRRWASIAAATVALRVCIAPLIVMQMRNTARMTARRLRRRARLSASARLTLAQLARPEMERLQQRMKGASQEPGAAEAYQKELYALWAKHNCNPFKSMAPLIAQAPLFICFFLAIKRMAVLPSFADGGALWFTDLSAADPYLALPVLSSLTFLATTELSGAEMAANPSGNNIKWGLRALSVAMVPLTYNMPQGVFVYWVTTNSVSMVQTLGEAPRCLQCSPIHPPPRSAQVAHAAQIGGHPRDASGAGWADAGRAAAAACGAPPESAAGQAGAETAQKRKGTRREMTLRRRIRRRVLSSGHVSITRRSLPLRYAFVTRAALPLAPAAGCSCSRRGAAAAAGGAVRRRPHISLRVASRFERACAASVETLCGRACVNGGGALSAPTARLLTVPVQAALRSLKIKNGSVCRLHKELKLYEEQVVTETGRTEAMRAAGNCAGRLKQQARALARAECRRHWFRWPERGCGGRKTCSPSPL